MSASSRSCQKQKPSTFRQANEHGIYAVRRLLARESQPLLKDLENKLMPELTNVSRVFEPQSLEVTVIGASRYDKRHRGKGPKTEHISEKVTSASYPIEAKLGKMAVYGSGRKHKLAIGLISDGLIEEENSYMAQFEIVGFPLRRDYNDEGFYSPHLSIALINNDRLAHFKDPRTIRGLGRISNYKDFLDQQIVFDPVIKDVSN